MSKTDKDRPYWVRANDTTENRIAYHSQRGVDACWNNCTINTAHNEPRHTWLSHNHTYRNWEPCGYALNVHHTYHQTPHRDDRRYEVYGPARRAEREYTRAAADSYNTFGQEWDDEGMEPFVSNYGKNLKQYWRW